MWFTKRKIRSCTLSQPLKIWKKSTIFEQRADSSSRKLLRLLCYFIGAAQEIINSELNVHDVNAFRPLPLDFWPEGTLFCICLYLHHWADDNPTNCCLTFHHSRLDFGLQLQPEIVAVLVILEESAFPKNKEDKGKMTKSMLIVSSTSGILGFEFSHTWCSNFDAIIVERILSLQMTKETINVSKLGLVSSPQQHLILCHLQKFFCI